MTYIATVLELSAPQEYAVQLPPPRSPEEVISMLIAEAPEGEHSVDAL